jgi:hypothetical protein
MVILFSILVAQAASAEMLELPMVEPEEMVAQAMAVTPREVMAVQAEMLDSLVAALAVTAALVVKEEILELTEALEALAVRPLVVLAVMEGRLATRDPLMAQQGIEAVMQEEQSVTMAETGLMPTAATAATVGVLHLASQERIAKALFYPSHSKNMVGCAFCFYTRSSSVESLSAPPSVMPYMLPC